MLIDDNMGKRQLQFLTPNIVYCIDAIVHICIKSYIDIILIDIIIKWSNREC